MLFLATLQTSFHNMDCFAILAMTITCRLCPDFMLPAMELH